MRQASLKRLVLLHQPNRIVTRSRDLVTGEQRTSRASMVYGAKEVTVTIGGKPLGTGETFSIEYTVPRSD